MTFQAFSHEREKGGHSVWKNTLLKNNKKIHSGIVSQGIPKIIWTKLLVVTPNVLQQIQRALKG